MWHHHHCIFSLSVGNILQNEGDVDREEDKRDGCFVKCTGCGREEKRGGKRGKFF